MKAKLLFLTAMLSTASALGGAQSDGTVLAGVVRASGGTVIPKADIRIHWNCRRSDRPRDTKPHRDIVGKTNEDGQFTISVNPAFYDVCAFASGFSATCATIPVKEGQVARYDLTLQANPSISREFGDNFFEKPADIPTIPSDLPDSHPPHQ